MSAKDGHGRTRAEREERRQQIMAAAARQALRNGVTLRCQYARDLDGMSESAPGTDAGRVIAEQAREQHQQCKGESRGDGSGCLCECHDPVAEVLAG